MMDNKHKTFFSKLHWKDIRKEFAQVNPDLAAIIDDIDPGKKYNLYRVRYPFGAETVREGTLLLPNAAGRIVPFTDKSIPADIQEDLGYNEGTNPVCFVLKNKIEVHLRLDKHTIPFPLGIIPPGKIFSTSRVLSPHSSNQPAFLWSINAGARTLLMLPKISSAVKYERLKRNFDLKTPAPKEFICHFDVFKELFNHPNFGEEWFVEIIYFGKEWFTKMEDKAWLAFSHYLYKAGWHTTEFWRNQFVWNLIYSLILKKRNLRPDPYIMDTVKNLIAIGVGAAPGFAPALNNDIAPVQRLKDIFSNIYQLEYEPIIMQLANFSMYQEPNPVYYFLHYPTTLEFSPKAKAYSNKITTLCDIQYLAEKIFDEIASKELNVQGTLDSDFVEKAKCDYFHNEAEGYEGIKNTKQIPIDDPLFVGTQYEKFPSNSPLINGCVRISKK
jgi:hypothetical protein